MGAKDSIYDAYLQGEKVAATETLSGIPIEEVYTPQHVSSLEYDRDLGLPGEFPFTRGVYPNMYRGRFWTRRFQVGFGTPKDTNERLKFLFKEGQTGFTLTIDLPTSYGFDSDDPISDGEVGVTGVAIDTAEDLEAIYDGFSPDQVSGALSIRPPVSSVTLAMLALMAERRNIPFNKVLGTQQNDPVYQMSGGPMQTITQFFPFDGTLRLNQDIIEFMARNFPKVNWMVTNAYNMRETGLSAVQEGAFALSHAFDIFRRAVQRGLNIDEFAPRASFFCSCGIDFFEEIGKFRAMRRIYARTMQDEFGAKDPKSLRFRSSVQTAGNTLTTQQPLNNVIRTTVEAMASIFSGLQSVQLASYDEGLGLPTEESSRIALRTQQILGYETGITQTVDPLAGSYYVEALTNEMEKEILALMAEVDKKGGLIECAKSGWLEQQIIAARLKTQREIESGAKTLVGVNRFQSEEEETDLRIHKIRADEWGNSRAAYLKEYRATRNQRATDEALGEVTEAMKTTRNMIPVIMDALKAKATMGEIHEAMRQATGFRFR